MLSGASTSSLGVRVLRQDPKEPLGTMWGEPLDIRSDEFLTGTSLELNVLSLGHTSSSPLSQSPDLVAQASSGQPFETVFYFEGNLLRLGPWLPDTMLFAGYRALPLLLLALTLPRLLRRLGASRPLSWLAYALVVLAPATLWWSFVPARLLSYASLGSLLLVVAAERWTAATAARARVGALLLAAVGGVLVARLGTYYPPWSLTIGVPLVLAVAAWLVAGRLRRAGLLVLGVGAVCGALMLALVYWENSDALDAMLNTAFPGERRSTGDSLPLFHLFGAPGLFHLTSGVAPAVANQSEISSAFLVCGLWALLVVLLPSDATRAQRAAVGALGLSLALWVAWCTVSWGTFGASLPLVNLVAAPRAAQTVGYAAALLLCVVLSLATRISLGRAALVAAACGGVTAYGVANLRAAALPTMTVTEVWLVSLLVAACVFAVTAFPRWWTVVPVCLVLLYTGVQVNPVILGLGDLRASGSAAAARQLGVQARADGTFVASDNPFVSALLVANGAPSVTGWQISGPVEDQWLLLDPDRSDEEVWNRGASYLRMSFDGAPGADPVLSNPNPDIVQISVDPCGLPAGLRIDTIVSSSKLEGPCLTLERSFEWTGSRQRVYSVAAASS